MSFNPPDLMTLAQAMTFVRRYVDAVTDPDPFDPGERLDSSMRAALAIAKVVEERDAAIAEVARLRAELDEPGEEDRDDTDPEWVRLGMRSPWDVG